MAGDQATPADVERIRANLGLDPPRMRRMEGSSGPRRARISGVIPEDWRADVSGVSFQPVALETGGADTSVG